MEKHWRIVRNRLTESKGDKGLSGRYWKYAAIIMLLLGGGVLGWFMQREENVPVDVTQQIHPGISKARYWPMGKLSSWRKEMEIPN